MILLFFSRFFGFAVFCLDKKTFRGEQIFKRFMVSGDLSDLTGGSSTTFGLRDVFFALANAVVGSETVASASSAVSMLAMVNDIVSNNGRTSSIRNTSTKNEGAVRGELEMDDIDISW